MFRTATATPRFGVSWLMAIYLIAGGIVATLAGLIGLTSSKR